MTRPTILISDDEPRIIAALGRMGRMMGLDVVGDTHGERIVAMARELQPELIVLDVNQPVDGRDVLAQLKKDPGTRELPVIMLSAVEDQYTRLTCLELGALDYAVKPIDITFLTKLARLAEDPGSTATLALPASPL
ncbi:MAG TPA: response regulator [Myxococcaceae bacterium]|nr:response regulator [Myxococcaceae bacterium]